MEEESFNVDAICPYPDQICPDCKHFNACMEIVNAYKEKMIKTRNGSF